ncbi:MAG: S1 RNA-binding domain-containing protein [candidate division WOR-3 bacterium]
MSGRNEIIISANEWETRLALIEKGQLVEFHIERAERRSLIGRVYKAKVENVVKGLRGAFVDIGLRKNGFLPLAEIPEFDAFEPELEFEPGTKSQPSLIPEVKEGQDIIVQVVKEPFSEKGARVTSYISLAGRYMVYFPAVDRIGISRRVRDRRDYDERSRHAVRYNYKLTDFEAALGEIYGADLDTLDRERQEMLSSY